MLPFVGRERELARLRARLAAVRAGRGGLVLLAGEAGIGKTTLARAFTASAAAGGTRVLWGSCREGQWQLPFGPWVEALVVPLREQPPDRLRQLLGSTVGGLPRLFPQLTALFPELPSPLGLAPEEERLYLAEAVVYWLVSLASAAPLVLVLDDLHWADRDSLDLLRYVARATGRAAVLVIGIYRTPDLDFEQNEGLRDVLGVLPRETEYEHFSLGGLTGEQVVAYLAEASGGAATPAALAETLHLETGGNPFFLRECYRHLVEEGALTTTSQWGVGLPSIPPGVTQVVVRRFERLNAPRVSPRCSLRRWRNARRSVWLAGPTGRAPCWRPPSRHNRARPRRATPRPPA